MGRFLCAKRSAWPCPIGIVVCMTVERRTGFSQVLEEDFRNLRWIAERTSPKTTMVPDSRAQGLRARHAIWSACM